MRHRKPLTAAELAEIYDREPTPTVLRLLQEIHRLRSTVLRADQIRRMIGKQGSAYVAGSVWECFERELDAEPCVTDPPTPRQAAIIDARMRMLEEWRKNGRKG
ncbi:hypothetical protein P0D71_00715 [Paraburkholderia sp. RL17-383-BIF-A]|uniref:hypothetical protein n=1 Tax=Paraburkholderia sp. RL17-383-BIF-A TaxID=3031631 RepID=UPI0038B75770